MDCYEWRNCEGDCENCEVANMDIAQAVQHWPDADFMTHNYSPEEVLGIVRQLGGRVGWAEHLKQAAEKRSDSYANRYAQAAKQRDYFANLLCLAARFAEQSPETQVEADNGEIVDGSWLAAKVRDELEERE